MKFLIEFIIIIFKIKQLREILFHRFIYCRFIIRTVPSLNIVLKIKNSFHYKTTVFKPNNFARSLPQLAGNKIQSQEVTNKVVCNKMRLTEVPNRLASKL